MGNELGIYIPSGSNGFELCHPADTADFELLNVSINGRAQQQNWTPVPMRLVQTDMGLPLALSDAPWLGSHALIFRPSVIEAMKDMVVDNGELLPLDCAGQELVTFNPNRLISPLDEARSDIVRFASGRIVDVTRYAFSPEIVGDSDVFKITNLRVSPTFLSHRFVARWVSRGLKGLSFSRVWPTFG